MRSRFITSNLVLVGCALLTGCSTESRAPVPGAACTLNTDCEDPLSCAFSKCHQTCRETRDCMAPARCVKVEKGNVCQLPDAVACFTATTCSPNQVCGSGNGCVARCTTASECAPQQACVIDGKGSMEKICAELNEVAADGTVTLAPVGDSGASGPSREDGGPGGSGGTALADAADATLGAGADGELVDASGASADVSALTDGHAFADVSAPPDASAPFDATAKDATVADRSFDVAESSSEEHRVSNAPWHLWVLESASGHVYGYAPEQLRATNGDAPEIDLKLSDPVLSIRFDATGNLWGEGTNGSSVVAYSSSQLTGSGSVVATVKFNEPHYGGTYLVFDKDGNLWTSGGNGHGIYRYDAADLAMPIEAGAVLSPKFTSTANTGSAVVIDGAGNLYSTFDLGGGTGSVGRYDASQITGTGSISAEPALRMNPAIPFGADFLLTPEGDLLIATNTRSSGVVGEVYRYSKTQIAQTGGPATPPQTYITFPASSGLNPSWEALDPDNNLWLSSYGGDHIIKLSASDLVATGTLNIAPSVTVRAPVANPGARFSSLAVH